MKKIKNETGSITTMVTVTIIFFITILSSAYMLMAVQRKAQLKSQLSTREAYQEEIDNANEIYYTLIGDDKSDVNEVPIPDGFVYVGGTRDSGLVISDAAADKEKYKGQTTVGTDLQGNQFVWIPVDSIADYKRTAYSDNFETGTIDSTTNSVQIKNRANNNYFKEALPADEKTSVETNKGFYIGRYEAGDQESTNSKKLRARGASTSNTITVKAGQAPYNYVSRTQAKSLAEAFSTKQGYTSVKSKLVSSYAWDTAIAFIQKTNNDYGSSSEEGNYNDSPTFTYTGIADTEKNKQTKANGTSTLIPTGQTTAVNNIYDMGGNVDEWTTESCSDPGLRCTVRGGDYYDYFANNPAGYRISTSDDALGVYASFGFRCTLYL